MTRRSASQASCSDRRGLHRRDTGDERRRRAADTRARHAVRLLTALALVGPLVGACGRSAPPAQPGEANYLVRCDLPEPLAGACKACKSASPAACLVVARAYEKGEQLPRDELGMVAFERRACELGSGRGCVNLSNSYRAGSGVEQRLEQAEVLWSRGCAMSERKCDDEGLAYECVAAGRCRLVREASLEPRHLEHAEAACGGGDELGCTVAIAWQQRTP